MKICKYTLRDVINYVLTSDSAKVLSVGLDGENNICVWMAVDDKAKQDHKFTFELVLTGSDISTEAVLAGRVTLGALILHIYYHTNQ